MHIRMQCHCPPKDCCLECCFVYIIKVHEMLKHHQRQQASAIGRTTEMAGRLDLAALFWTQFSLHKCSMSKQCTPNVPHSGAQVQIN